MNINNRTKDMEENMISFSGGGYWLHQHHGWSIQLGHAKNHNINIIYI